MESQGIENFITKVLNSEGKEVLGEQVLATLKEWKEECSSQREKSSDNQIISNSPK